MNYGGGVHVTETELCLPGAILPLRSIDSIQIGSIRHPHPLRFVGGWAIAAFLLLAMFAIPVKLGDHPKRDAIAGGMLGLAVIGVALSIGWMLAARPRFTYVVQVSAGMNNAGVDFDTSASANRFVGELREAVSASGRPLQQIAMINNLHTHARPRQIN